MKLLDKIRINKRILRRNWSINFFERIISNILLNKICRKSMLANHIIRENRPLIHNISQSSLKTWTDILSINTLKMVKINKCICRYMTTKDNFILAVYVLNIFTGEYACELVGWRIENRDCLSNIDMLCIKALFELDIGLRNDAINELLGYYKGENHAIG